MCRTKQIKQGLASRSYVKSARLILLLLLVPALWSCSPGRNAPPGADPAYLDSVAKSNTVTRQLLQQYEEWKNTPYRAGGLSKQGVDCSGFVYLTFRTMLGVELARTTKALAKSGDKIPTQSLRAGDLVFFKTGLFTRHVGIYLGEFKFLHASTTHGVIISSLKETYWNEHFWLVRRVLI